VTVRSLGIPALASAVLFFAGCAGSVSPSAPGVSGASNDRMALVQSPKSPAQLLELQAAGRLQGPVPAERARLQLQELQAGRPQIHASKKGKVAIWATDTNFNYLLGQTANGRNTVTAVDLSRNFCLSPVGVRVDKSKNVWVACELTSPSATAGALQQYDGAGNIQKQYLPACPVSVEGCTQFQGYGWDSGIDSKGDVIASLNLYSIELCNPSCNSSLGAGFELWPKGKSTSQPALISTGANCAPICGVGFMDVDASNNIWFTFSGYEGTTYGFGLGEVTNVTTKPALSIVEPIGTYGFFGGVYTSNKGNTLNVVDQKSRTISQYHLPLSTNGKPFNVLGPVPQNAFGIGDPVTGGFNKNDTKLALGDTGGWLDLGAVPENTWSLIASPNFYTGLEGAAYTPSDK
jgi:hypothetical protein